MERILSPVVAATFLISCGSAPEPQQPDAAPEKPVAADTERADPRGDEPWWPEVVDLSPLRQSDGDNPYGSFDYRQAFAELDHDALKADIRATLKDSKDWWPADYGHYGPLFVRMAWHSAGTYRLTDGRGGTVGGQQRFEPLNSWPDNANLDKARRLLWPVKKKYGHRISWGDLMVLAGNVAMEDMGFDTLGFAGGRVDDWQSDGADWGPEGEMLASSRHHGKRDLEDPLAATRMGLIYVNPEGPDGKPDPKAAAHDIRTTFGRMGMNDEETVALIAGGHTFGKAHGAHDPGKCLDVEPAAAGMEHAGMGWHNRCGTGNGADTVTSGLEGAWTSAPDRWTHMYLQNLWTYDWTLTKSPAGAHQWKPTDEAAANLVPDAHDPSKRHAPMMFTTDLSLKEDPAYAAISERFHEDPKAFEKAFAQAWFKLTHRDLGPRSRYLGPDVPEEVFAWQDPLPERTQPVIGGSDVERLKGQILAAGVERDALVRVAWASASTFRHTDMRGGANGARIRLAPQNQWDVNDPEELSAVLSALEGIKSTFESKSGKTVSMADLIVLGGAAAIEASAKDGGIALDVPFRPGRVDATQEMTDVEGFGYLEPKADAFRNYYGDEAWLSPADAMVERADLLDLTVPEMTALVGGMRVLGATVGDEGVLTDQPGVFSNDFYVQLMDRSIDWAPDGDNRYVGKGTDGKSWTATDVDLVFVSNAELRTVTEAYAADEEAFRRMFVQAWTKVMEADRFDLDPQS